MNEVNLIIPSGSTDVITRYLRDEDGYVDLTGKTVMMKLTRVTTGAVLFEKACTVFGNQVTGKGRIDFTPISGDFGTTGRYRVIFTVTGGAEALIFPRGKKQRFYIWVQ